VDLRPDCSVHIVTSVPEADLSDNRRANIINWRASEDVPVGIQEDILAADVGMSDVLVVYVLQHISQILWSLDTLFDR